RAVLRAADPVGRRPPAQPCDPPRPSPRALLGSVREDRGRDGGRRDANHAPGACPRRRQGTHHMTRLIALFALMSLLVPGSALAQTKFRVATCARTITTGVGAPFAVAMKMGYFKQEGLDVEIVPLPGSTDCVKTVATRELPVSLPSVEPLAIGRPQG